MWKIGLLLWITTAILAYGQIRVIQPNGSADVKITEIEVRYEEDKNREHLL